MSLPPPSRLFEESGYACCRNVTIGAILEKVNKWLWVLSTPFRGSLGAAQRLKCSLKPRFALSELTASCTLVIGVMPLLFYSHHGHEISIFPGVTKIWFGQGCAAWASFFAEITTAVLGILLGTPSFHL